MIQSNQMMRVKLPLVENGPKSIAESLLKLCEDGFVVFEGCVFLQSLLSLNKNAKPEDFPDKTGFECYVNAIHIDDYVQGCDFDESIPFLFELLAMWNNAFQNQILRAIISSDEFGTVLRFHMLREGESWLSENLEEYEEAILVADSTDVNSLGHLEKLERVWQDVGASNLT